STRTCAASCSSPCCRGFGSFSSRRISFERNPPRHGSRPMAAASNRERVRTVVLALLGLLFFAPAIGAVVDSILHAPRCTAGPMLNAVLATLGVFVFLAARNPPAHRSLILFAAWSSFAHAAIMLEMSFQVPAQRGVLLASAAVVCLGGVLLMVVAPSRND